MVDKVGKVRMRSWINKDNNNNTNNNNNNDNMFLTFQCKIVMILWHFGQNAFKEGILGRHWLRWENNTKMDKLKPIKEMQYEDVA
jgi:hypothetical protein